MNNVQFDHMTSAAIQQAAHPPAFSRRSHTRTRGRADVLVVAAPDCDRELRQVIGGGWPSTVVDTFAQASQALNKQSSIVVLDGRLPFDMLFALCQLARAQCCGRLAVMLLLDPAVHIGQLDLLDIDMVLPLTHDQAEMHWWLTTLTRIQTFRSLSAHKAIEYLLQATATKDTIGDGHLQRIERYAVAIGHVLELPPLTQRALRYGALLHDIGKLGIADVILGKPAQLTSREYAHVQQHPIIGEKIIQHLNIDRLVGTIIRHHHERWDGNGYPDRLSGMAIPLCARIVAVVDAFDAMTNQRPYNTPYSLSEAIQTLRAGQGKCWDPTIVTVFTRWLETQYLPRQRYAQALHDPHTHEQRRW